MFKTKERVLRPNKQYPNETLEDRRIRLKLKKETNKRRRAMISDEEHLEQLERRRAQDRKVRLEESVEKREKRLASKARRHKELMVSETKEQREVRLASLKVRNTRQNKRKQEVKDFFEYNRQ